MKCMSMVCLSGFAGIALLAGVALAEAGVQTPGSPDKTVVQAAPKAPRAPMTAEERAKRRAEFKAKMDARRQARQAEMAAAKAAGTNRLARVQYQMQGGLRKELEALRAEVKALRADVEALKAAKK